MNLSGNLTLVGTGHLTDNNLGCLGYNVDNNLGCLGYNEVMTFNDIFQQQRSLDSGSKDLPE